MGTFSEGDLYRCVQHEKTNSTPLSSMVKDSVHLLVYDSTHWHKLFVSRAGLFECGQSLFLCCLLSAVCDKAVWLVYTWLLPIFKPITGALRAIHLPLSGC